ncbi:DUF995 domain-containing protein [Rhizobium rhizogenes]|uniref:DUF995 domain-containing protein n=1 Tax=Rhizobium rhizogenes TaxID=359 RepID=UPI000648EC5F|nr:DUF995 domain-containing protein [Rhizobium rhizogenes]
MSSFRFVILNAALSTLLLFGTASAATQQQTDRVIARAASKAAPMSAAELHRLYVGRSWVWKNGAGFFSKDRNHFVAWSRTGAQKSYAKGNWHTSNSGKLCMKALWYSKKTATQNVSCFLHREKAGVIYQKRASSGKWYVFRHNPLKHDDEVRKLRRGNYVSKHLPS